MTEHLEYL